MQKTIPAKGAECRASVLPSFSREKLRSYNLQPWRFVVVREREQRIRLRAAAMDQQQIEQAPVVIVACGDTEGWREDLETIIRVGRERGFGSESQMERKRRSVIRSLETQPNMPTWVTSKP